MKLSIKNTLYLAILENKWIEIDYVNKNKEETNFYIGIKDINPNKDKIFCDIFNPFRNTSVLNDTVKQKDLSISFSGIKSAEILDQSYYESPKELIDALDHVDVLKDFLEVEHFDNNILRYLADAYQLDNDPYLKNTIMLPGIDLNSLSKNKRCELTPEQFAILLEEVFKKEKGDKSKIYRKQDLSINSF